jgi:hypothetical protein
MNSGIKCPPSIIEKIGKLKEKKLDFLIITIPITIVNNKKSGVLELTEEMEVGGSKRILEEDESVDMGSMDVRSDWYLFRKRMKELPAAYGACWFHYETPNGPRSNMVYAKIVTDDASVNEKMFYSSTFEELKSKMEAEVIVEVDTIEELKHEDMISRMPRE